MKINSPLNLSGIKENITEANLTFIDSSRRIFLKKTFLFTGGFLLGSKMAVPNAAAATLAAPTNFLFSQASAASSSAVTFSWNAVTGAEGYKLFYRTEFGVTWALLQDVGNVTSKTYNTVPAGTYYIAVVGYAGGVNGSPSDVLTCYRSFPPPTFLSSSVSASGTVTLTWNAVSGAAGYYINAGTSATGPFSTQVDLGNVTIIRLSRLTPGTTYYAYFTPYNSSGTKGSNSVITKIEVP